ncbi:MAG: hypothetical protein ACREXK_14675 [Gammaproteobacteria bacterium]
MSEYQYYEFQTIDRPLTDREMSTLRNYSSRATITSTRFVNRYSYGSFKGNASEWMNKYFDAFLYLANWGTHELMLRLPRGALDLETAERYLLGDAASARAKGDAVILSFRSEEEGGDWVEDDEGRGWMSSVIPVRADLASGDLRVLYLGWLLSAQVQELDEDALEPPVPARLDRLSASIRAFADFLRIDDDLIAVAAERSSPAASNGNSRKALEHWVGALPDSEKTDLLVRLVAGDELPLRAELLRRFRSTRPEVATTKPRTVAELFSAAGRRTEERRRKEAARVAREKARREREEAAARERFLDDLARREPATWKQVDALIATKKPADYDEAVRLLGDLKDLGARSGRIAEVQSRIQRIREEHAKKPSFIERLQRAGFLR